MGNYLLRAAKLFSVASGLSNARNLHSVVFASLRLCKTHFAKPLCCSMPTAAAAIATCHLPIAKCLLQQQQLPTESCLLPNDNCLLTHVYLQLPTDNCLLTHA